MARIFSQEINAVQMFKIVPSIDAVSGTMTLIAGYVVGYRDPITGNFGIIQGAANNDLASVTVPLTTTLADANAQLGEIIAQQEGLTLTKWVDSVSITNGGSGYVSPTVMFSDPVVGGIRAMGTVTQVGGAITGVTVTNPGSGYESVPVVTISDSSGSGTGAVAVANVISDMIIAPV